MLYGSWISASGALTNSYKHDVIANNLANVDTVGFKSQMATFNSRKTEVREGNGRAQFTNRLLENLGGGIFANPTSTNYSQSSINITGNEYDVAINGKGFFQVDKEGQTMFTRDGRFAAPNGVLVTQETNFPILDVAGKQIEINNSLPIEISKTGQISQNNEFIGQLGIVGFDDLKVLTPKGENLFAANGEVQGKPVVAQLSQKALEESGVDATREFVSMIDNQRLLETNLKMLKMQDESLGKLIRQFSS